MSFAGPRGASDTFSEGDTLDCCWVFSRASGFTGLLGFGVGGRLFGMKVSLQASNPKP